MPIRHRCPMKRCKRCSSWLFHSFPPRLYIRPSSLPPSFASLDFSFPPSLPMHVSTSFPISSFHPKSRKARSRVNAAAWKCLLSRMERRGVFPLVSWFRDLFIGVSRFWSFPPVKRLRWRGGEDTNSLDNGRFLFSFSFFLSFFLFFPLFFLFCPPFFPRAFALYTRRCCIPGSLFFSFFPIFALNDACEEKRARGKQEQSVVTDVRDKRLFRGRDGWFWSILKLALRKNGCFFFFFLFFSLAELEIKYFEGFFFSLKIERGNS